MILIETDGDHFRPTAICVSAQALQFDDGLKKELRKQKTSVGEVAYVKKENGEYVFYLVVMKNMWGTAHYADLRMCLRNLAELCKSLDVRKISIPRYYNCGFLGKNWEYIKHLFHVTFHDVDVEITVYSL